jgi:hypothetical protein
MQNRHQIKDSLERAFQTLELGSEATEEMVKRTYRELVKVWHPDRFENDASLKERAQEKLKQINLAYALLTEHFHSSTNTTPPTAAPTSAETQIADNIGESNTLDKVMWGIVGFALFLFCFGLKNLSPDKKDIAQPQAVKQKDSQPLPTPNVISSVPSRPQASEANTKLSQSISSTTSDISKTPKLSPTEKETRLRQFGYDPKLYYLADDDQTVYRREEKPTVEPTAPQFTIPNDVKFVIFVDRSDGSRDSYFSKKKPEPFGAGYKIYEYFTKSEIVLNGQMTITPVNQ